MLVFHTFYHLMVVGGNKWTWALAAGPRGLLLVPMLTSKTLLVTMGEREILAETVGAP